jgi:hypothetical protein
VDPTLFLLFYNSQSILYVQNLQITLPFNSKKVWNISLVPILVHTEKTSSTLPHADLQYDLLLIWVQHKLNLFNVFNYHAKTPIIYQFDMLQTYLVCVENSKIIFLFWTLTMILKTLILVKKRTQIRFWKKPQANIQFFGNTFYARTVIFP